jgi:hypothetical protein
LRKRLLNYGKSGVYRDGHDFEDWLDAEAIVMEEIHEARE